MNADVQRARSIFLTAVENHTPDRWAAFLDGACAGDQGLRHEVEVLLRAHEQPNSLLDRPTPALLATADETVSERPGTVIGPYKLLEQIGEGGFGIVFLAEQMEPIRRKVALKVIKPGMDTKQVVARFEAERQALALMDHPNIAHVYDGGATESGRPFFVMELVKGAPITEFCDQNRLGVRARLELFVSVCQAVQHAHQKGIIHRDLKPFNILVTSHDGTPVVKVIDFGIAKATGRQLTDRTLFTGLAQMIGTPLYMSPEQAQMSGLDIDTRSDIYSLGVLLYELLTGTTPFDQERLQQVGYDEIRRIIREEEPARPSTRMSTLGQTAVTVSANRESDPRALSRLFRGDLDWIVMKALEKDRSRRYETANGFAQDVQRYLDDEPVLACPPSVGYRLRKFVRRNRAALAVTALLSAALVLAVVVLAVSNVWVRQALQNESAALALARTQEGLAREQQGIAEAEAKRTREQETTARRHLYAAHANLAAHAWEVGSAGRGLRLLEGMRLAPAEEDLRSFEWYALWRLFLPGHRLTLRGHGGPVQTVAYSPDGTMLATASDDETVRLWDAATGRIRGVLRGHKAGVNGAAFSPDGKTLATAGQDGTVKLWDLPTGRERGTFTRHAMPVNAVAFSPDGTLLAAGGGSWGKPGELKLWDVATRQERATLKGHWSLVWSVAFSPDGAALASASADGTTRLWDVTTGRARFALGHVAAAGTRGVAFTPDGKTLASCGQGDLVVKLWDVDTGQERFRFPGHTGAVQCVAVSPDGKTFASGGDDGTVRLWDPATGQRRALGHVGPVRAVAFAPDGKTLATAGDDTTAQLWDLGAGQEPAPLTGCTGWALAPDGKTLALSRGETVQLRDVATGQERAAFPAPAPVRMAFAPDAGTLIARGRDGTVRVWDVAAGRERAAFRGHPDGGDVAVAISPDGKRLAYRHWGGPVILYDVATGKEWLTLKDLHAGVCMAFASDGKTLATGSSGPALVELWDLTTGHNRATLGVHSTPVRAVAFAPHGKALAAACHDGTIHLWDLATTRERARFRGHEGAVQCLAFCPDGKSLASGGEDRTVKLWDLATGEERMTLRRHASGVRSVMFSDDGKTLAAGDADGTVILLRAASEQEVVAQSSLDIREERARRHADRGRQLRADNRPRDAEEAFRQARDLYAELAAEFPRFYRDLGVVQQELGQPEEAARAFRQLAAVSKNAMAHNNQAWSLATAPDPKTRLPALAVALAERAVELAPQAGNYWHTLGAARYRAGNWDGAVAALEKGLELHQGGTSYDWFFLAMARWRRGDREQARKWYAAAVLWADKHAPENAELRRFRAEAAALLGLDESWLPVHDPAAGDEAVWTLVVEGAPGVAWAYTRRGEALAALKQWDRAGADFARAVELAPRQPLLHHRHALARLAQAETKNYRDLCAGMLTQFGTSSDPNAAFWTIWTCVLAPDAVTDWRPVVALAEKAVADDPRNCDKLLNLSAALYRAERYQEAAKRLEETEAAFAQTQSPRTSPVSTWLFQAMTLCRLGRSDEAQQQWRKALTDIDQSSETTNTVNALWNRRLALRLLRQEAENLLATGSEAGARVHRFARRSEWKKASEGAARWKELDADEHQHLAWFYDSVLRLQLGDVPGYRQVCRDMLTRFGQTRDPAIMERTVRTCLLRPAAVDDLKPVLALAEQLVSGTEDHWARRWLLLTRGAAAYRAGEYESAIDWLQKSMDVKKSVPQLDAFAASFLAMAHHRVGQTEEARRRLEQASRWLEERARNLEPGDLGMEWSDWARIQIVHREAEALIGKRASDSTR